MGRRSRAAGVFLLLGSTVVIAGWQGRSTARDTTHARVITWKSVRRDTIRFPDNVKAGIPAGARVNASMFAGLSLTTIQGDSIMRLSQRFAAERRALLPGVSSRAAWDAATRARMTPFMERERLAYRAVLNAEQQPVFDRNTTAILRRWSQGPEPSRRGEGKSHGRTRGG